MSNFTTDFPYIISFAELDKYIVYTTFFDIIHKENNIRGMSEWENSVFFACLGVLPGGYLMYISTRDTGQIMNIELPLGLIVVAFYLICSIYIFVRNKSKTKKEL